MNSQSIQNGTIFYEKSRNRWRCKYEILDPETSKFKMKLDDGITINLDGEKSGHGSFNFSVINKGLPIIVPKKYKEK